MKYLIVGLGNPGNEYLSTRHNIGFLIADSLAKTMGAFFSHARLADQCSFRMKGKNVFLIKPATFMNLSGKAVNYWLQREAVSLENLLIITDDIALPQATLRIKPKGRDGGHNGLASIIEILKTTDFPRLRFGIGNEFKKGAQSDFVLSNWTIEEQKDLPEQIERAVMAVKSFISSGVSQTMNVYNKPML